MTEGPSETSRPRVPGWPLCRPRARDDGGVVPRGPADEGDRPRARLDRDDFLNPPASLFPCRGPSRSAGRVHRRSSDGVQVAGAKSGAEWTGSRAGTRCPRHTPDSSVLRAGSSEIQHDAVVLDAGDDRRAARRSAASSAAAGAQSESRATSARRQRDARRAAAAYRRVAVDDLRVKPAVRSRSRRSASARRPIASTGGRSSPRPARSRPRDRPTSSPSVRFERGAVSLSTRSARISGCRRTAATGSVAANDDAGLWAAKQLVAAEQDEVRARGNTGPDVRLVPQRLDARAQIGDSRCRGPPRPVHSSRRPRPTSSPRAGRSVNPSIWKLDGCTRRMAAVFSETAAA